MANQNDNETKNLETVVERDDSVTGSVVLKNPKYSYNGRNIVGCGNIRKLPARRLISESQSKVQTLFDHLPQSMDSSKLFDPSSSSKIDSTGIDPLFYNLGLKYSKGLILGSNQRCIALLQTLINYIKSFNSTEGKSFRHEFSTNLKLNLNFLKRCRPFAVSMENAIESFNSKCQYNIGISNDQEIRELNENEIKNNWIDSLNEYIESITKGKEAIVEKSIEKIENGDKLLIYGYSEIISDILLKVMEQKLSISLVIIDDRTISNEKNNKLLEIIHNLNREYINPISYISIIGLSNIIQTINKVFIGAHALLTNGGVLGHVGTSQIALLASTHNIPVLVCCETYKFCDKCPTDSFFHNELINDYSKIKNSKIDDIGSNNQIGNTISNNQLDQISDLTIMDTFIKDGTLSCPIIKYDLTPSELVTACITDIDILPTMSVPVVLRVQETRQLTIN